MRSSRDFMAQLKQLIARSTATPVEDVLHVHCRGVAIRTMMHVNSLKENDQLDVTLAPAPVVAVVASPLVAPPSSSSRKRSRRTTCVTRVTDLAESSDDDESVNATVDADIAAAAAMRLRSGRKRVKVKKEKPE